MTPDEAAAATPPRAAPLVSVVMPTYNYARYVGDALRSLQAQTHARWECVVVDDGSTDDTEEVVAGFAARDARIRYVRQENRRQAAARNNGLRHCAGDYVQFLDADDLLESRKLERQAADLEAHPEVDIVYGGARGFTSAGQSGEGAALDDSPLPAMPEASGGGRELAPGLVRRNIMFVNSPLVRRRLIEEVGSFDERLPPAEDWDYWLRCALKGARFQFVPEEGTLALVRTHPVSSSRNRAVAYASLLRMRGKLAGLTDDAELLALNRELAAADEGYLGVEEAAAGRVLKGVLHLGRAALRVRRARWRAKWLLCALSAPFVSPPTLRKLATESITRRRARTT
ncbi:MAG TPA: glycosyltransferase [Pyrinomonadaceae bacterium]